VNLFFKKFNCIFSKLKEILGSPKLIFNKNERNFMSVQLVPLIFPASSQKKELFQQMEETNLFVS